MADECNVKLEMRILGRTLLVLCAGLSEADARKRHLPRTCLGRARARRAQRATAPHSASAADSSSERIIV